MSEQEFVIKTFQDGVVQAVIVSRSWQAKTFYRARFRREYRNRKTGAMAFAYDFDDYHVSSLLKVGRQAEAWLKSQKAEAEATGRP